MALAELDSTAREATPTVAVVQRPPQRRFRGKGASASANTEASTWTTTWYRSPGAPGSRPWWSAVSASNVSASACSCAVEDGSEETSTGPPAALVPRAR
jgi:hypothetical protein